MLLGRPRRVFWGDAEYVYDNSTDVALDMRGTKAAAASVWRMIQEKDYSTRDWSKHELHPKAKNETTVDFIFLMDLLNFSFWSESDESSQQFAVEYRGKRWTGYWSLVAALQRALDERIPISSPSFWVDEEVCTDVYLKYIFRSATGKRCLCSKIAFIVCGRQDTSFRRYVPWLLD